MVRARVVSVKTSCAEGSTGEERRGEERRREERRGEKRRRHQVGSERRRSTLPGANLGPSTERKNNGSGMEENLRGIGFGGRVAFAGHAEP